jgi:hypothetical protein
MRVDRPGRCKLTFVIVIGMVLFLGATSALAQDAKQFGGTWIMKIGDRNLFVLSIQSDGKGIHGTLSRPAKMRFGNPIFTGMSGVRHDQIVKSRIEGSALHFTTQNANDPKDEDLFVFRLHGDSADLSYDDLPPTFVMEPIVFGREQPGAKVATDWQPNRAYVVGDSDVPNAEMKTIFDEDQRVRTGGKIDGEPTLRNDAERREQTRKLLVANALHTGKDYEEASVVFQHGSDADDYLLAHVLAMVAVSKGDANAIWISAATLDRYLQKVGQKQVLGTQFLCGGNDHRCTQQPYDSSVISDSLRRQLGVPPLALQAEQLNGYEAQKMNVGTAR